MFISYTFTQPYFLYIEYVEYNVIPSNVTLTFDSPPSSNPEDYSALATYGILDESFPIRFSTYANTLTISGNTAILTLPNTIDSNCYVTFYYQSSQLPFQIRANQDLTFETPAIFQGLSLTL